MSHFDSILSQNNVSIRCNTDIGEGISIKDISNAYDVVTLCTGMSDSKRNWAEIPESYGADQIVGWYNSRPDLRSLKLNLKQKTRLVIVGNGNVALDVARIFAKPVTELSHYEFDPLVLESLTQSNITDITILGRRGPLEASFSPSELREFLELKSNCSFEVSPPMSSLSEEAQTRIQKKNIQILDSLSLNMNSKGSEIINSTKKLQFNFFTSIEKIDKLSKTIYTVDHQQNYKQLKYDLLVECVGFKQKQLFASVNQESDGKFISTDFQLRDNVFTCGWARIGAKGTVADSMKDASVCSERICSFLNNKTDVNCGQANGLKYLMQKLNKPNNI